MGCCNGRTDDPFKFTPTISQTIDTMNVTTTGQEETTPISGINKSIKSSISLRELIQKPTKNKQDLSTPEGKTPNIINLKGLISNNPPLMKTYIADLSSNFDNISELVDFKVFDIGILQIDCENDCIMLDYIDSLRQKKTIDYTNLVPVFNYEIVSNDRFLLKNIINRKKLNKLSGFKLLVYKEHFPATLSQFLRENIVEKEGVLDENLLISFMFSTVKTLLYLRTLGIDLIDLNEDFFSIDIKNLGVIKLDPTKRRFSKKDDGKRIGFLGRLGYLAPELNGKWEEYIDNIDTDNENSEENIEKLIKIENFDKIDKNIENNEESSKNHEFIQIIDGDDEIFNEKYNLKNTTETAEIPIVINNPPIRKHINSYVFLENTLKSPKSLIYSLGILLLRMSLGPKALPLSSLPSISKSSLSATFQEILTIKYPKLWYFIDKMLEENPEKRISLEEMLNKSSLFPQQTMDFLGFLPNNETFDEKNLMNYDEYDRIIDYINFNITVFQPNTALMLISELKANLVKKEVFLLDQRFFDLAYRKSQIMYDLGDYKAALAELNFLSENLENYKNTYNFNINSILFQSALCYKFLNKHHKSIEILTNLQKKENLAPETLKIKVFNELADISLEKKEFEHCESYIERSMNIKILIEDDDYRVALADSYEINSRFLMIFKEDFVNSLEEMKKAHIIRKKMFSSESLQMIKSYKLLALGYLNVGDLKDALRNINKNLSLLKLRENLIRNPSDLQKLKKLQAESLKILSKIQMEFGEAEKSEKTYKDVLEIYEELYGFYSKDIVGELQALAGFYNSINSLNKAIETFKICSEIIKNVYGKESLEIAENWSLIGELYEENGKFSEAIEVLLEALKLRLEFFGGTNASIIELLIRLSKNYELLGFLSKAVEFGEKGLELLREELGIKPLNEAELKEKYESPLQKNCGSLKDLDKGPIFYSSPLKSLNIEIIDIIDNDDNKGNTKNNKKGLNNNKNHKAKENLIIECLFRLGGLYRKMGMSIKARACFIEEKHLTTVI